MTHYPRAEACAASTHAVENMPPVLENYNPFTADVTLLEAVTREGAGWATGDLAAFGRACGSAEWLQRGFEANRVKPVLETHDRYGNRIDHVTFHPAYHELMASSVAQGLAGSPWAAPKQGAHVARAAGSYLMVQVEAGHGCPITMTFAAVPTLKKQPDIAKGMRILLKKLRSGKKLGYQGQQADLDEQTKEALRSLGYTQ